METDNLEKHAPGPALIPITSKAVQLIEAQGTCRLRRPAYSESSARRAAPRKPASLPSDAGRMGVSLHAETATSR